MYVDFHCHLLPGMDDGAADVSVSLEMVGMLQRQGIAAAFATPHYLPWLETPDAFAGRRTKALRELQMDSRYPADFPVLPAAEVALERDLSKQDLMPLCYAGHPALLLELPKGIGWDPWMGQEIENIAYRFHVQPVLAHLERYLYYPAAAIRCLLQLPHVVVQLNAGSLRERGSVKLLQHLYHERIPVLIGTDAHDTADRPPDFEFVESGMSKLFRSKEKILWDWIADSARNFLEAGKCAGA